MSSHKVLENIPKLNKSISDQNRYNTEDSIEPPSNDGDYDMVTGANPSYGS